MLYTRPPAIGVTHLDDTLSAMLVTKYDQPLHRQLIETPCS